MIVCTSDEILSRRHHIEKLFFMDVDTEEITKKCADVIKKIKNSFEYRNFEKSVFMIGVRSDQALKNINGYTSPTKFLDERISHIESMMLSDIAIYIDDINSYNAIRDIMPNFYVKTKNVDLNESLVLSYGGKIIEI